MSNRAETVIDEADQWVRDKTFGELLEKKEVRELLKEMVEDTEYWESERPKFNEVFEQVDSYLRKEDRPLKEILREGMADKIVKQVSTADISPGVVKAFMRTPAMESMAGAILYTGIQEFIQRADVLGNIVNTLPVIGPIRKEISKALRETMDATLGGQIKDFLGTQSRPAVEQMIRFILEEKNKKSFGASAGRLATFLLSQPVSSLLPSKSTALSLRDEAWEVLQGVAGTFEDNEELLDIFFEEYSDKKFGEVVPELPQTAKKGLLKVWQRFLDSEGPGLELSDKPSPRRDRIRDFE